MPKPENLTAEQLVTAGIRLLEALSAAPGQRIARAEAARMLGVRPGDVDAVVETVSALSDRTSGARAAISVANGEIRLQGEAALLSPRRFTMEEALVIAHVLDALDIDAGTRGRIRDAVMPYIGEADAQGTRVAEPARYGSWFTALAEAIEDGIRCRISYRALGEDSPSGRLVDPMLISDEDGASYLVGWDVEKDAERRYRLDRIAGVSFTDDSVDRHPQVHAGTAESLRASGRAARLVAADAGLVQRLDWAGIGEIEVLPDGRCAFTLWYSSDAWLFDQVLSAGGDLVIEGPGALREGLAAYADGLTR